MVGSRPKRRRRSAGWIGWIELNGRRSAVADGAPTSPSSQLAICGARGAGGRGPQYLRSKLTSLPWILTRSGPKIRVS